MRGSEQDTTSGLADADEVAGGRGGHYAILTDQKLLDAVCGTDLCNDLGDLGVVVAAITADDERGALGTFGDGVEDGGNEVLGVVGLLEDLDLLAKTGAVRGSVSRCRVIACPIVQLLSCPLCMPYAIVSVKHGKLYWQTHGSYHVFQCLVQSCGQGGVLTYVPGFWSWKGLVSTVLTLMIAMVRERGYQW